MTHYGAKHLADAFRTVRKNTITIAEEIPEDKYNFRATPETRTVAQTLVHIATTPRVPLALHRDHKSKDLGTFDFFAVHAPIAAEEQKTRTKAEVLHLLKTEGDNFALWLETLSPEFLAEVVTFPPQVQPPTKTRFEMLMGPKEHEMHHRGQLMLIQRMLGMVPHLTRQMEAMRAQMMAARK